MNFFLKFVQRKKKWFCVKWFVCSGGVYKRDSGILIFFKLFSLQIVKIGNAVRKLKIELLTAFL